MTETQAMLALLPEGELQEAKGVLQEILQTYLQKVSAALGESGGSRPKGKATSKALGRGDAPPATPRARTSSAKPRPERARAERPATPVNGAPPPETRKVAEPVVAKTSDKLLQLLRPTKPGERVKPGDYRKQLGVEKKVMTRVIAMLKKHRFLQTEGRASATRMWITTSGRTQANLQAATSGDSPN